MLNADGRLSHGVHSADFSTVMLVFGWNAVRRALINAMTGAFRELHTLGCGRVWLDGSFVTDKPEPGDYDAIYEHSGMDVRMLRAALPELFDAAPGRPAMKRRFGGDLFPNVREGDSGMMFVDFFQLDKARPGAHKGILTIDLVQEFGA